MTASRAPGSSNRWVAPGTTSMVTGAVITAAAASLSCRTCGSRPPTMRRVGACTRERASPARSGRPPREMTSRTRSGRSAAVTNAAAAPVLAPNNARGRSAVSSCCASQSTAPVSRAASRRMSKRSSAVRRSMSSSSGCQQVQQQGGPANLLQCARHAPIARTVATAAAAVGEEHDAADYRRVGVRDRKISVQHDAVGRVPGPAVHAPCRCSWHQSCPRLGSDNVGSAVVERVVVRTDGLVIGKVHVHLGRQGDRYARPRSGERVAIDVTDDAGCRTSRRRARCRSGRRRR